MPSPFPGMDPYLENPKLWRGVHDRMIPLIAKALNDALPTGYFADINERVYISEPRQTILPDVAVLVSPSRSPREPSSATAILDRPGAADPSLRVVLGDEVREPFVEIMTTADQDRVVTSIEVISPANKTSGSGWDQYTRKQRQTLDSFTHLLEIDLLRQGTPILIPPPELLRESDDYDYVISLHRARTGYIFDIWLRGVRERLPRVDVPLSAGDPDIVLDLQEIFDRCYDDGPYQQRVDYNREPIPPLRDTDAAWAGDLLREKGLRR